MPCGASCGVSCSVPCGACCGVSCGVPCGACCGVSCGVYWGVGFPVYYAVYNMMCITRSSVHSTSTGTVIFCDM